MAVRQQPYQTFLNQTASPDADGTAIMRFEAPFARDAWDTVRFVAQVQGLQTTPGTSLVLADAFGRTVSNGWGTPAPTSPGDWSVLNGNVNQFGVNGSAGTIGSQAGTARAIASPVNLADVQTYVAIHQVSGAVVNPRVFVRGSGTWAAGDFYIAEFVCSAGQVCTTVNLIQRIAGTETTIGSVGSLSIAEPYQARFGVVGSNLYAKIWNGGEPSTYTLTGVDFGITAAGSVGAGEKGSGSVSSTTWDNFLAADASVAATLGITWEAYRYQINPQNLIYRAGPTTALNPQINFPFYAQSHDAFYVVAYGVPAGATITGHMEVINSNPLGE